MRPGVRNGLVLRIPKSSKPHFCATPLLWTMYVHVRDKVTGMVPRLLLCASTRSAGLVAWKFHPGHIGQAYGGAQLFCCRVARVGYCQRHKRLLLDYLQGEEPRKPNQASARVAGCPYSLSEPRLSRFEAVRENWEPDEDQKGPVPGYQFHQAG